MCDRFAIGPLSPGPGVAIDGRSLPFPTSSTGSVGMSMVRRLTRRPTAGDADTIVPPTALTADEVAYRIGVAGAPGASSRVGGVRAAARDGAAATAAAARAATASQAGLLIGDPAAMTPVVSTLGPRVPGAAPGAPDGAASPRVRLVRDAAVALIGLVVVGLVVLNLFPQAESRRATERSTQFVAVVRGQSDAGADPEADSHAAAVVATASPTPSPTPLVTATPAPHAETDTQADRGPRRAPPRGRRRVPTRGADAAANAETDAEAHRETDPQADADSEPKPIAFFSCSQVALLLNCDGSTSSVRLDVRVDLRGRRSASGANPPGHLYTQAGTYQVKLTVTNSSGSDSDTQSYTVP